MIDNFAISIWYNKKTNFGSSIGRNNLLNISSVVEIEVTEWIWKEHGTNLRSVVINGDSTKNSLVPSPGGEVIKSRNSLSFNPNPARTSKDELVTPPLFALESRNRMTPFFSNASLAGWVTKRLATSKKALSISFLAYLKIRSIEENTHLLRRDIWNLLLLQNPITSIH